MQFFCEKFSQVRDRLFPPRPFFEPLWRGCTMSCFYSLVCSQFPSCRQQQGAQHGLNTQVFTLICRRILCPSLSFCATSVVPTLYRSYCIAKNSLWRKINIENASQGLLSGILLACLWFALKMLLWKQSRSYCLIRYLLFSTKKILIFI